jgi:hypothetical protein
MSTLLSGSIYEIGRGATRSEAEVSIRPGERRNGEGGQEESMADHALCPRCGHENPPENRYCGSCGALLEASNDIIARREDNLAVRDHVLPARLGHAGKAIAVGLAMLGAEVGLYWIRHRTKSEDRPSTSTTREADAAVSERLLGQSLEEIFIQQWEGNPWGRTFAWRAIRSIIITEPTDRRS